MEKIRRSPVEGKVVFNPIIYRVSAPSQVVFSPDFWTINSRSQYDYEPHESYCWRACKATEKGLHDIANPSHKYPGLASLQAQLNAPFLNKKNGDFYVT